MNNFIAILLIFGIPAILISLAESKNKWARHIGDTIFGLIAAALSSIIAMSAIGAVIVLGFGVMMWFFPNVDFKESIFSISGLIFWVLIFVALTVVKAWWDKRKEKQTKIKKDE